MTTTTTLEGRAVAETKSFLTVDDLCELFGQARIERLDPAHTRRRQLKPRPLSRKTIWTYVSWSRTGPYRDHPMPMPSPTSRSLIWVPEEGQTLDELKRDLVDWYHDRH